MSLGPASCSLWLGGGGQESGIWGSSGLGLTILIPGQSKMPPPAPRKHRRPRPTPDGHGPWLQLPSPGPAGLLNPLPASAALPSSILWALGQGWAADRAASRRGLKFAPAHALWAHQTPGGRAPRPHLPVTRGSPAPIHPPCPTSPGRGQSSPIPSTGVYQIPPFVLRNLISFLVQPRFTEHFTIGGRPSRSLDPPGSRGSRPILG